MLAGVASALSAAVDRLERRLSDEPSIEGEEIDASIVEEELAEVGLLLGLSASPESGTAAGDTDWAAAPLSNLVMEIGRTRPPGCVMSLRFRDSSFRGYCSLPNTKRPCVWRLGGLEGGRANWSVARAGTGTTGEVGSSVHGRREQ